MLLRNVGIYLQVHNEVTPRRLTSASSPPRELQISYGLLDNTNHGLRFEGLEKVEKRRILNTDEMVPQSGNFHASC
jgi:hypothetical protein